MRTMKFIEQKNELEMGKGRYMLFEDNKHKNKTDEI